MHILTLLNFTIFAQPHPSHQKLTCGTCPFPSRVLCHFVNCLVSRRSYRTIWEFSYYTHMFYLAIYINSTLNIAALQLWGLVSKGLCITCPFWLRPHRSFNDWHVFASWDEISYTCDMVQNSQPLSSPDQEPGLGVIITH